MPRSRSAMNSVAVATEKDNEENRKMALPIKPLAPPKPTAKPQAPRPPRRKPSLPPVIPPTIADIYGPITSPPQVIPPVSDSEVTEVYPDVPHERDIAANSEPIPGNSPVGTEIVPENPAENP